MIEIGGNGVDLGGQLEGEDIRAVCLYFGDLNRIIVNKDKAIEAKLKLFRQRLDILRFRFPVDAG